ncbi:MAG TPA: hypothetical protein VHO70_13670 [Chitinispirillaceae bacterium]|nr:hypothetical protein [Chitinispirillaceae bacterium]
MFTNILHEKVQLTSKPAKYIDAERMFEVYALNTCDHCPSWVWGNQPCAG